MPKNANLYNGSPSITDGQRWDSWGRFTSYLFATVAHQSTNGPSAAPDLAGGHSPAVDGWRSLSSTSAVLKSVVVHELQPASMLAVMYRELTQLSRCTCRQP